MTNIVDLSLARFLKETAADVETARLEVEEELAEALSLDISRMDGRQLRQLRDGVLRLKLMLIACSPEMKQRLSQKVNEVDRELTPDEITAAMLSAQQPSVRFI